MANESSDQSKVWSNNNYFDTLRDSNLFIYDRNGELKYEDSQVLCACWLTDGKLITINSLPESGQCRAVLITEFESVQNSFKSIPNATCHIWRQYIALEILFTAKEPNIYLLEVGRFLEHPLLIDRFDEISHVAWSHGGEQLAISDSSGLWICSTNQLEFKRIVSWRQKVGKNRREVALKWSPDDTWLLTYGTFWSSDDADLKVMRELLSAEEFDPVQYHLQTRSLGDMKKWYVELINIEKQQHITVKRDFGTITTAEWGDESNPLVYVNEKVGGNYQTVVVDPSSGVAVLS